METDHGHFNLGQRIECDGYFATVRFINYLPNTEGIWLGVEWDDFARGKHDGSLQNIRYFTTSHPTSGSFLRPKKCRKSTSFLEAVRDKYGAVTDLLDQGSKVEKDVKVINKIQNKEVVFVGMEKIKKTQSRFKALRVLSLSQSVITDLGTNLSLDQVANSFPNVRDLNLSRNLISTWDSLEMILQCLPALEYLNLSGNRIALSEEKLLLYNGEKIILHKEGCKLPIESKMESGSNFSCEKILRNFRSVKELGLGHMELDWNNLRFYLRRFPDLKKLSVSFNRLTSLGVLTTRRSSSGLNSKTNEKIICAEQLNVGKMMMMNDGEKNYYFNAGNEEYGLKEFVRLGARLELLDLEGNAGLDWEQILEAGKLPNLTYLNANNCSLTEIYFPNSTDASVMKQSPNRLNNNFILNEDNNIITNNNKDNNSKTDDDTYFNNKNNNSNNNRNEPRKITFFPNLSSLHLSSNMISNWHSIDQLNNLTRLTELTLTNNIDLDSGDWRFRSKFGQRVIARLAGLKNLNGSPISRSDRQGAEIDYLTECGREWRSYISSSEESEKIIEQKPLASISEWMKIHHPRYFELVSFYGPPIQIEPVILETNTIKSTLVQLNFRLVKPGQNPNRIDIRDITKKLPKTMQLSKLKVLLSKLFSKQLSLLAKTSPPNIKLSYLVTYKNTDASVNEAAYSIEEEFETANNNKPTVVLTISKSEDRVEGSKEEDIESREKEDEVLNIGSEEEKDIGSREKDEVSDIGSEEKGILLDIGSEEKGILLDVGRKEKGILLDVERKEKGILLDVRRKEKGIVLDEGRKEKDIVLDVGSKEKGILLDIGSKKKGIVLDVGRKEEFIGSVLENEKINYGMKRRKEVEMTEDFKDLSYYSLENGQIILIRLIDDNDY